MVAKYRSKAQELQKHADYLSTLENPNMKLYTSINNLSFGRFHQAYHGGSNRSTWNSFAPLIVGESELARESKLANPRNNLISGTRTVIHEVIN
jgi:hypothetical protein